MDALHSLIQSLTKNEKGYFKKYSNTFSGQKKNNKYVKLFDLIEKQNEYNEKKIMDHFAGDPFVKQVHVAKNYLYNNILKCLVAFRSDELSDVRSSIMQIEVLCEKKLYDQSLKLLKKSKQVCTEREFYPELFNLLIIEIKIVSLSDKLDADRMSSLFDELIKYTSHFSSMQADYKNVNLLNIEILSAGTKKEGAPETELTTEIKSKVNSPTPPSSSFHQFYYRNVSLAIYANLVLNWEMQNKYSKVLYASIDRYKLQFEARPKMYLNTLRSYAIAQMALENYNESISAVQKMRTIKTKDASIKNEIAVIADSIEIELLYKTKKFNEALNIIRPYAQNGYITLSAHEQLVFAFTAAHIYTIVADYRKALRSINVILNKNANLRKDILFYAQFLSLIIHFELQNINLFPAIVRSIYRTLHHDERFFPEEKHMLTFFKKYIYKINNKKELVEHLTVYKKEMEQSLGGNKILIGLFDLSAWIESKLLEKPMIEILAK